MSSVQGIQTVYLSIIPIPDLLAKKYKELGHLLCDVHEMLNFILAAVVIGQIGATLMRHLIDKVDVLARMLPRF